MPSEVLANIAFDQQKVVDATAMSDAQDGLGTWSSPSTVDHEIGQAKPASNEVSVANERLDLSDIPENATITSVTATFDLDINTTTTGFRFELYPHAVTWPTVSGDWPTSTILSDYFTAGKRLAYFDIASGTALGSTSFTIDNFAAQIQLALVAGDTYFDMILVSSDHRTSVDTGATSEYIEVEDSVAGQQIQVTVNYTVYDNTSDELVTVNPEAPGADDSYMRYQNATYSTAAAGAGTLATAAGLTISGQSFSGSLYSLYESFEEFDISSIPAGAIITDVKFEPYFQYGTSTQVFDVEVYDLNWTSLPPTAGIWQTPTELTSLYDTGKRVAWLPQLDVTTINTRFAMNIDGWVRRMQAAVDAAQSSFKIITCSSDLRGAVVPTTAAEYAYWEDGDGGANASELTVYYTLGGTMNTMAMGAAF